MKLYQFCIYSTLNISYLCTYLDEWCSFSRSYVIFPDINGTLLWANIDSNEDVLNILPPLLRTFHQALLFFPVDNLPQHVVVLLNVLFSCPVKQVFHFEYDQNFRLRYLPLVSWNSLHLKFARLQLCLYEAFKISLKRSSDVLVLYLNSHPINS